MFRQFTETITANQVYLIGSLSIFLIFFLVVGVMLLRMKKKDVEYMKKLPIGDEN